MSLKITGTAVLLMMASSLLFAETAKGAAEKAAAKDNLEQSIAWLNRQYLLSKQRQTGVPAIYFLEAFWNSLEIIQTP